VTTDPHRASQWTAREIESDNAAYIAARKVEREDRPHNQDYRQPVVALIPRAYWRKP